MVVMVGGLLQALKGVSPRLSPSWSPLSGCGVHRTRQASPPTVCILPSPQVFFQFLVSQKSITLKILVRADVLHSQVNLCSLVKFVKQECSSQLLLVVLYFSVNETRGSSKGPSSVTRRPEDTCVQKMVKKCQFQMLQENPNKLIQLQHCDPQAWRYPCREDDEEMSVLDVGGNPIKKCNQVGTENSIHIRGSRPGFEPGSKR